MSDDITNLTARPSSPSFSQYTSRTDNRRYGGVQQNVQHTWQMPVANDQRDSQPQPCQYFSIENN
jgi:hypothetical protein